VRASEREKRVSERGSKRVRKREMEVVAIARCTPAEADRQSLAIYELNGKLRIRSCTSERDKYYIPVIPRAEIIYRKKP
jgi:hypothetical protein